MVVQYLFLVEILVMISLMAVESFTLSPPLFFRNKSSKAKTIRKDLSISHNNKVLSLDHDLESICSELNEALQQCSPDYIKTCKIKVGISPSGHRLGLMLATPSSSENNPGETVLSIPYDDQIVLTPNLALNTVWKDFLPQSYTGWTGDVGLIALLILNELARASSSSDHLISNQKNMYGIPLPRRNQAFTTLIFAWIKSLPTPAELSQHHPLLWDENTQEILQSSSTKKIYRLLDDIDEDATWLEERVWSLNRKQFPESVLLDRNGTPMEYPCFTSKGFLWAYALASSRSVYVDGSLRLIPIMDMANHEDNAAEIMGGSMGPFGTTKGAILKSSFRMNSPSDTTNSVKGRDKEVFVSYGIKSAAEYLLENGFIPKQAMTTTSVAQLTFEIDPEDRFYDDKMDILEFETYENAPMEPVQNFDVVSQVARESEPDPTMIQFLRLVKLGGFDAFLLESVFRKQVWGFMSMPVSENNEKDVLDAIADSCTKAIGEMDEVTSVDLSDDTSPLSLCAIVRRVEKKALSRTLDFVNREKEALDLKEYYQQRRLKDLGLDSQWTPEDNNNSEDGDDLLGYDQKRKPGGLDW